MNETNSEMVGRMADEAQRLNAMGLYDAVLAACEAAFRCDPTLPKARFEKSYALFRLGRLNEAIDEITRLCRDEPGYPDALWLRAGILRCLLGDYAEEVVAAYREVLQADPANLYALSEYADMLRSQGKYEEARAIYIRLQDPAVCHEEALRIEAAFQTGVVAQVLGDIPAARAAFKAVVDAVPDYPDAQAMLDLLSR